MLRVDFFVLTHYTKICCIVVYIECVVLFCHYYIISNWNFSNFFIKDFIIQLFFFFLPFPKSSTLSSLTSLYFFLLSVDSRWTVVLVCAVSLSVLTATHVQCSDRWDRQVFLNTAAPWRRTTEPVTFMVSGIAVTIYV